jgi:hypothetical protein
VHDQKPRIALLRQRLGMRQRGIAREREVGREKDRFLGHGLFSWRVQDFTPPKKVSGLFFGPIKWAEKES